MYLRSIKISNVRSIRSAQAEFQYFGRAPIDEVEYPNINLLLGNNGMGKSATLKAVALVILAPVIESAGYVPYSIVRRDSGAEEYRAEISGELILHEQDIEVQRHSPGAIVELSSAVERIRTTERVVRETTTMPLWESMFDDESPAFLLVGYGASRTMESSDAVDISARRKSRLLRYDRVAGLFEEHTTLIPLAAWLPKMQHSDQGRHAQVVNLIDRLLPEGTNFNGEYKNGKYRFEHDGLTIALDAMSDGYRAYLSWICDLLYHICMAAPDGAKLVETAGIVLIDEIDLHLHPEWQLSVLPKLSKVLPNLQFICTTHSPIVVGTVFSANIHLLKRDDFGGSVLERPDVEVHGLNADQILLTPAFGLTSSRAPSFVQQLRDVSQKAGGGDPDDAMRLTRMLSHGAAAEEPERMRKRPDWIEQVAEKQDQEG